jgi:hypothetical protein
MTLLFGAIVLVATVAVFLTTKHGREVAKRIGLRNQVAGAATSEDLDFLLMNCNGDRGEVDRRIEAERRRFPELSEADHTRRAIRKIFAERDAGSSPIER